MLEMTVRVVFYKLTQLKGQEVRDRSSCPKTVLWFN